jgi:pantoate--beta-alanine ligase
VLVRRLVEDLNLGTAVVIRPTVREGDGLALSSRNTYLTPAQRQVAPILYQALQAGKAAMRGGMRSGPGIQRAMLKKLSEEPSALVEYVSACEPDMLEPLRRVAGRVVLVGAVRIGRIRLIDNLLVKV